jgi:hypothetical protein
MPTARYRQSRKKERSTDKTPQNSSRNGNKILFISVLPGAQWSRLVLEGKTIQFLVLIVFQTLF